MRRFCAGRTRVRDGINSQDGLPGYPCSEVVRFRVSFRADGADSHNTCAQHLAQVIATVIENAGQALDTSHVIGRIIRYGNEA